MAIKISSTYAGRVDTNDPAFPYGKGRNIVGGVEGTGTPFEADWYNNLEGFLQRLLTEAGIVPDGDVDTADSSQLVEAVKGLEKSADKVINDDGSTAQDTYDKWGGRTLPNNDFNKVSNSGFYLGFGDGAGELSSINAPSGSGNVRFSVSVRIENGVVFQDAVAGNSNRGLWYYRTAYIGSSGVEDALNGAKWNALPTLTSPNTFTDNVDSTQSMINLEHYADGSGSNSQTYGLDIHNNPNSKSAVVVHQYSNDTPAVWLDNTDNQPMVRINNTHNSVRNPDGPVTSEGDFLELKTEGLTKFRLRHDYVFQANGVRPTFFGAVNGFSALNIQTPNGNLSDTLQVQRANTSNDGSAINIENSGGIGLRVNQAGEGLAAYVQSNQNQDMVQLNKTGSGTGDALQIRNSGTGQSLRIERGDGSVSMAVDSDGLLVWRNDNEQTTVGVAGTADPLPSNPDKYLRVRGSDGVDYVVPAFKS